MISEDIEDLVCVVVRSRMHELAEAMQLLVVTLYQKLVNPITNPNPCLIINTWHLMSEVG
jgi:hypothetical protein